MHSNQAFVVGAMSLITSTLLSHTQFSPDHFYIQLYNKLETSSIHAHDIFFLLDFPYQTLARTLHSATPHRKTCWDGKDWWDISAK